MINNKFEDAVSVVEFTSSAKHTSKGKKTLYVVFANGVEIGRRETGRSFKGAQVSQLSLAWYLDHTRRQLSYEKGELAKHQRQLTGAFIAADFRTASRAECEGYLASGKFAEWAANSAQRVASLTNEASVLESQFQSDAKWQRWIVNGFTNTGKPSNLDHHHNASVVTLVQP